MGRLSGPRRAETFENVTGRAGPGRDFWNFDGPGRAVKVYKCDGLGRAAARPVIFWWAGSGRGPPSEKWMGRAGPRLTKLKFDGPGRAAAHEMWTLYGPLRPAHEAAHVFWRTGPDRCPRDVVYDFYCYYCDDVHRADEATHMFDGLARAVAHDMLQLLLLECVPESLCAKNSNVCTMHFWQITPGV